MKTPLWELLPFKQLKEIKQATSACGLTSPYTLTLVESLASQWMTPYDWFQVAKACLAGGTYLLWKAEYEELVHEVFSKIPNRKNGEKKESTYDMIMGAGEWLEIKLQKKIIKDSVGSSFSSSWRHLPAADANIKGLANVKQRPKEPFVEFIARLTQAVERVVPSPEARDIILKQLAFENVSPTCQSLLRTMKKSGSTSDYTKACAEVSPSYLQGVAIADASQGQTTTQFLVKQEKEMPNQGVMTLK